MRKQWKWLVLTGLVLALSPTALYGCGKRESGGDLVASASQEEEKDQELIAEQEKEEKTLAPSVESSSVEAERIKETAPAMKDTDETVYVTGDQVNLRKDGYSTAEIAVTVPVGTEVKRTGYSDTWCRVVYEEQILYIATQYLSAEKPEIQEKATTAAGGELTNGTAIALDPSWTYADYSKIHTGAAMFYQSQAADRKHVTICVNAGHGTTGGSNVKTLCHPDGTPKVTGGSTQAGATSAIAVSSGMVFLDGTPEAKVTLAMAKTFKEKLLAAGYDVVMIRETDDVQLDNIARTVIANNTADCHIAIHWDSSTSDKGAFYMSVPDIASYRNMEPVKSHWQQHNALGESVVGGLRAAGVKIFSGGSMALDLTQTSYSTVPSIDIELGDKGSDYSQSTLDKLAAGMVAGVNDYFGK